MVYSTTSDSLYFHFSILVIYLVESDLSNQKSQTYPWEALIFKIQKLDLETLTHIIPEPNVPEIAQK
jgi:hypothetical protein